MERYVQNASAVFSLKLHLVWCPKYRRDVLKGTIATRLDGLLRMVAAEINCTIHAMEVMPDHVHIFVEHGPTRCVAEIVNRLKGRTSRTLRTEFPSLKSRLPTLWTRSYYAASIGQISEVAIRRYIEDQKGK